MSRTIRVHVNQALAAGSDLTFDQAATHHLVSVLRLLPGQSIRVFNGDGFEYQAILRRADRHGALAEITVQDKPEVEIACRISLGLALIKGERMDYAIQKATELGVDRIVPLQTERSEVRLNADRARRKMGHWQRVAISASEQSGRVRVPRVESIQSLPAYLNEPPPPLAFILTPGGETLSSSTPMPQVLSLLSGPEGGWSDTEIQAALTQGYQRIGLGPRILRAETAPLAMLSIIQYCWG